MYMRQAIKKIGVTFACDTSKQKGLVFINYTFVKQYKQSTRELRKCKSWILIKLCEFVAVEFYGADLKIRSKFNLFKLTFEL